MTGKKLWEDADRWMEMLGCKVATSEEKEKEERGKKRIWEQKTLISITQSIHNIR